MQQPINRVSHVVYCLEPDHLDEAAQFLSEVLGAKFEDSSRPELGLRILVSLENGLELIAPAPELGDTPERFTRFLAERGEGVYNIVYGVDAIDETAARAERYGVAITHRSSFADVEPWVGRFDALDEVHLETVHGIQVTLGRIVPSAENASPAT